jgi:transcriptional regulator with XRE-family HTH domain
MTEKYLHGLFSSNLKKYRKKLNMSQSALAKKAGISVNFINDLEAEKKWPSFATLVKLTEILGIDVYELLKPPAVLSDSLSGILRRYTDNINAALEQTQLEIMQNALKNQESEQKKD